MNLQLLDLLDELKKKNIRLSHQRVKILEFLMLNKIHPTVDDIYTNLKEEVPTLSKTTIYNTVNSLAEAGILQVVTIEDNELRYDITTDTHGHFKCNKCKKIYDFDINMELFKSNTLENFEVTDKNVYFKGICPSCQK